jgi:hypothetical protein
MITIFPFHKVLGNKISSVGSKEDGIYLGWYFVPRAWGTSVEFVLHPLVRSYRGSFDELILPPGSQSLLLASGIVFCPRNIVIQPRFLKTQL